jgi:hypothetical protein
MKWPSRDCVNRNFTTQSPRHRHSVSLGTALECLSLRLLDSVFYQGPFTRDRLHPAPGAHKLLLSLLGYSCPTGPSSSVPASQTYVGYGKIIMDVLLQIQELIEPVLVSPTDLLWAVLPHLMFIAFNSGFDPSKFLEDGWVRRIIQTALGQYSCVRMGMLPVNLFYDTIFSFVVGVLFDILIYILYLGLQQFNKILEQDRIEEQNDARHDLRIVLGAAAQLEDENEADDNVRELRLGVDQLGAVFQQLSGSVMYHPAYHRLPTYRTSRSLEQRAPTDSPEQPSTHLLEPTDPNTSGPLLLRIKDRDDGICLICWEPFDADNAISVLPCKHNFHEGCLKKWFESQLCCPRCTRKLELRLVAKEGRSY